MAEGRFGEKVHGQAINPHATFSFVHVQVD